MHDPHITLGVEEEFFLVDRESGALACRTPELVEQAGEALGSVVTSELILCQIETATPVCATLDELRYELDRQRTALAKVADAHGLGVLAAGTHPVSGWREQEVDQEVVRYAELAERYRHLAHRQIICGCHVHLGLGERSEEIRVMNQLLGWLPTLVALSASSPFWQGADTGYSAYRVEMWGGWPTAGFPPVVEDRAAFDRTVEQLVQVDAITDASNLYWYARPSLRHPTLEVRPCDTMTELDDVVAVSGLIRGMAATALGSAGISVPHERSVLDAAMWRAARFGLEEQLVDPLFVRLRPAAEVVEHLLDWARPGLEQHADAERVEEGTRRIVERGTGAARQREVLERTGDLVEVTRSLLL
ncbi:carboxylate-amine ligase [Actinomarinicola tropica]|uniref:Putative glutamate--cysteine ligase 2 n=1 Tax=Actinomarinicola tropica TaxID=2789776 RepID=A0A5Q2RGJ5_9ACTN|nr:glutamate--cysteine ligase [Actinomarinicola tropica]QGG94754.1 YbdK family carboxylate-amine ligase [Actinomarinicola tropica]